MFEIKSYKFKGIYRAKVLDNDDPEKLGRIKAEVYSVFNGLEASVIPWAVPAYPLWEGAGDNIGFFSVPKVDSFVFIFFEGGDHNSPTYFAEAQTALFGLPSFRETNYPNRKGWRTQSGIEFYVDDTAKEIKLNHPTGTSITISENGEVSIDSVVNVNIDAAEDVNITASKNVDITASEEVNVIASEDINITASKDVSITADEDIIIHSKDDTTILVEGGLNLAVYGTSNVMGTGDISLSTTGIVDIAGSVVNLNP